MRRPLKIAALLLTGAAVTVLVAWSSALWCETPLNTSDVVDEALSRPGPRAKDFVPPAWKRHPPGYDGRCDFWCYLIRYGTTAATDTTEFGVLGNRLDSGFDESFEVGSVVHQRCGWPLRCLECARLKGAPGYGSGLVDGLEPPALLVPDPQPSGALWFIAEPPPALPMRPVWHLFAASTPFYALIIGALVTGPGALRRWWRRGRGRCPNCGYDRRGLAVDAKCPECGAVSAAVTK